MAELSLGPSVFCDLFNRVAFSVATEGPGGGSKPPLWASLPAPEAFSPLQPPHTGHPLPVLLTLRPRGKEREV